MKYAVVTDDTVKELYGLKSAFSFPAGEEHKTRATKENLEDALLAQGFSKDTAIVGVGGGVVSDIAGFLAATFCRGVPLVLVPTTLLAMCDASIGGKNGVNTPLGKNMIGTVWHPVKVLIDFAFLRTLPEKELENGRVEMAKAFLLADPDFLGKEREEEAVLRAIEIKRRIVARDVLETGLRRILNLGHTVAHAIETLSSYAISHGEAVASGIVIESRLAFEMGILEKESFFRIESLFPPPEIPFAPEEMVSAMRRDKKSQKERPRFAMLKKLGCPEPFGGQYCTAVSETLLLEVLHDYAGYPCCKR